MEFLREIKDKLGEHDPSQVKINFLKKIDFLDR